MRYKQNLLLLVITGTLMSGYRSGNKPPGGKIAYARDEKEIRVITPDGSYVSVAGHGSAGRCQNHHLYLRDRFW